MFGKKKVKVKLVPAVAEAWGRIAELDRLATEIQALTGYSLGELKGLFAAGYTLEAPKQISMEELLQELRKEAHESM
jgi:hypothetical protein